MLDNWACYVSVEVSECVGGTKSAFRVNLSVSYIHDAIQISGGQYTRTSTHTDALDRRYRLVLVVHGIVVWSLFDSGYQLLMRYSSSSCATSSP